MPEPTNASPVALTVNGRTVRVPAGTTLLHAAREAGAEIPTLCYHPNLTANAVCRLCVVEVVGARNLQPSCVVPVSQDMVVNTETDRVLAARRVILELLASTVDLSETPEVLAYIERYGTRVDRFAGGIRREIALKDDNPFYIRDYAKCVMCWRCIQVCAEDVQHTFALTWGGRGIDSHVTTAFEAGMPDTTCVFCGNCVGVCPSGALKGKNEWQMAMADSRLGTKANAVQANFSSPQRMAEPDRMQRMATAWPTASQHSDDNSSLRIAKWRWQTGRPSAEVTR